MDGISGALARLISLGALSAVFERLSVGGALRLVSGLLATEAMLEIVLAIVYFK